LCPGHSDITRFRPWSPIATGNHLDRAEKIPKVAQTTGTVDVFDLRSGISGPTSRWDSAVHIFMNDGPNPLTWDAQLLSYWFSRIRQSSKISLWIWSIISGVVTVLGRPGRGASYVEKSPRLNWVAYDGACSPNVCVRMAWISFGALSCRGKEKPDDSSRLHVVEIARVAWHASLQPL